RTPSTWAYSRASATCKPMCATARKYGASGLLESCVCTLDSSFEESILDLRSSKSGEASLPISTSRGVVPFEDRRSKIEDRVPLPEKRPASSPSATLPTSVGEGCSSRAAEEADPSVALEGGLVPSG